MTERTKRCGVCLRDLPRTEFHRRSRSGDGLMSLCKGCNYERVKAWRLANAEAARAYGRHYWVANKARITEYRRAQHASNPRLKWDRDRAYRAANRDRRREVVRQWYEAHPESWREYGRRRKAAKKQLAVVRFTREQLDQRMSMFGHRCWMCGGPFEHVDHVKPLSKGGAHMLCNLRPACADCNHAKKARWPYDTRRHVSTSPVSRA